MAITAKPEILRPRSKAAGELFDDAHMDVLSHLLDDFIRIPGTPIRFGLDGIVGFIPGIGDVLGGLASTIIIVAAWSRGVPNVVVARMVLNVAIEMLAGSLPVVGNLFDIGWRANRRNYALLTRATGRTEKHVAGDWLFLVGVLALLVAMVAVPVVIGGWVLVKVVEMLRIS